MGKTNLIKIKHYLFILIFSSFAFTSCDDNGILPIFSTSYDLELGQQMDAQIKADSKAYPPYNKSNSDAVRQYVQGIVDVLIKAPEVKHEGEFAYKVMIIDTNIINAFCTPGGYIYVYTGLLKYVESEAELAAILGHEITHADHRHSVNQLQKQYAAQYGTSFLIDMFLGGNTAEIANVATDLLTNVALLQYGQADETDSDETSFKILKSTNKWYPGAAKYFFARMKESQQTDPTFIEKFFSTHPDDGTRINNINKWLKDNNIPEPTESNLFKESYTNFKANL